MAFAFVIIGAVLIWTAGRADWIVAYATGVAQLGVWLTLAGLVPVTALWLSLKRQPFVDQPSNQARAHWSVWVKVSEVRDTHCFCQTLRDNNGKTPDTV